MTDTEELLILPTDVLFVRLEASATGFSSQEAERRLRIYGGNELARRRKRVGAVEFLIHIRNPLIVMLMLAGLIVAYLALVETVKRLFYKRYFPRLEQSGDLTGKARIPQST